MTLYRCERLSASISLRQCGINQQKCFSCEGCPGVQGVVTIEEDYMASHRGYCATCKGEDRPLISKSSEECHSCYKRRKDAGKAVKDLVVKSFPLEPLPHPDNERFVDAMNSGDEFVDHSHDDGVAHPDGEPVPEVIRPLSPLCRLLDPDGWLVEIPRELSIRLGAEGITPDDINELLESLLNGELRRVL